MKKATNKIKNQLAKNELDEALKDLEKFDSENKRRYRKTILLLQRRLSDIKNKEVKGIIGAEEVGVEKNKITESIFEIAANIESTAKAGDYIDSLSREKTILLAGAGLSDFLGYKIILDLPKLIKPKVEERSNQRYKESEVLIKEIWENTVSSKTVENVINKLNAYFEHTNYYQDNHIIRRKLPLKDLGEIVNARMTWETSLELCYHILFEQYNHGQFKYAANVPRFLNYIKRLCKENSDNLLYVFTTNYDCLFQALSYEESVVNQVNLLTRINPLGEFDGENWFKHKLGKITHITGTEELDLPSILVERLHGCVSWYFDSSIKYGMREDLSKTPTSFKKINMGLKLTSGELGEQIAFSTAFNHFRRRLGRCEKLIIWGHSFRDLEVLVEIVRTYDKGRFEIEVIDCVNFLSSLEGNIRRTLSNKLESRIADDISLIRADFKL